MDFNLIITALALTTLAGLSTTIGSVVGVYYKSPGPTYMSFTLGFTAGVMVLVSFVELLPQAIDSLGFIHAMVAFFIGIFLMFAIDLLVPHQYIMEEPRHGKSSKIQRTSVLVAFGIAIHNFPRRAWSHSPVR
jgi:ZIP family zinc transporter